MAHPRRVVRRDGLTLRLELPKDTYWAGEGGQAKVTLRNDGVEPATVGGGARFGWANVTLLDEGGRRPDPWPWASAVMRGGPFVQTTVAPGQEISATRRFQVPPVEQAAGHTYTLQAVVVVSRPVAPGSREYRGSELTSGPLPLRVLPHGPAQQLQARLEADRAGWRLQVTDAAGQAPPGPFWGDVDVLAYHLAGTGPLPESADGRWSQGWSDYALAAQSAITVRIWVAVPGFVTASAAQTVPAPALRRVSVPPKADESAVVESCGAWGLPTTPGHPQILCTARVLAGHAPAESRGRGISIQRLTWAEAATQLGADPAGGPAGDRAVLLVELDSASAVGAVVVLDAATGAPVLLLEPRPAP